jgi:hypothetical protein
MKKIDEILQEIELRASVELNLMDEIKAVGLPQYEHSDWAACKARYDLLNDLKKWILENDQ